MKRCIVCGNIGDGSSEVCEVCGNPYGELEYIPDTDGEAGTLGMQLRRKPVDGLELSFEKLQGRAADYQDKEKPAQEIEKAVGPAIAEEIKAAAETVQPSTAEQAAIGTASRKDSAADIPSKAQRPLPEILYQDKDGAGTQRPVPETLYQDKDGAGTQRPAPETLYQDKDATGTQQPDKTVSAASSDGVVREPDQQVSPSQQPQADRSVNSGSAERPHRRMRSGPQIYGQVGQNLGGQDYSQQGMIRRNVQGRGAAQPADQTRPAGEAAQMRPSNVQGQPVRTTNGQMQGQPVRPANGQAQQARPANIQAQGRQPVPANGQVQGQPVRGMSGQMGQQVRPAAGQMPGLQMRPVNGQVQNRGSRPLMYSPGQRARQICEASRKMLKSPVFFLVALLHTVFLAGSVAAIFMGQLNYSQIARVVTSFNLPGQISGYANTFKSILSLLDSNNMIWVNVALHIPDLLFCLGLWLVFFTALAAKDRMSGIGFSLMKVDIVINMIIGCIIMLLVLVVFVAVVVAAWVSGNTTSIVFSAILLVVTIVVAMMVIMYYFSYLATLTTLRTNANDGDTYGKASAYVGIMHIILALTAIINLLSGIVNNEIASMASAIGKLGWMLLFGIWIMMYRGNMEDLEEED